MSVRGREVLRACVDEVERHGWSVTSTGYSGGTHQTVECHKDGRRERFFLALTPSDGNAPKKVRQDVRRRFRSA